MGEDVAEQLPRGVVVVAGWLAATCLATGVALAAESLIGTGLFGDATRTSSQDEVAEALASLAPLQTRPPSADPETPASEAPSSTRQLITSGGGTVLVECSGQDVALISWTPAQGYRVDDVDREAGHEVEIHFEGEDTEVRVKVRCADGRPVSEIDEDG